MYCPKSGARLRAKFGKLGHHELRGFYGWILGWRLTQAPYKLDERVLADLCASFQQAIIDVLVTKTIAAAQKHHVDLVTVSGGVSCNQELRRQLGEACRRAGFDLKTAESWLCTDNAAMIAFAALLRLQAGFQSKLTEEIDPNLALVT